MNKRQIRILIFTLSLFFVCITPTHNVSATNKSDWTENKLIAHAMGGISGKTYSNSYEAFIVNYEKGHRVFEVDLVLTSDDYLVAVHDWTRGVIVDMLKYDIPKEKWDKPLTRDKFLNHRLMDKYTPLTFDNIVAIMKMYPDIYIVTDTKEVNADIVKKQFNIITAATKGDKSILKRIIPQVYDQKMYDVVNSIYKFDSYIYTLYASPDTDDQVVEFVKDKNIEVVTMPPYRIKDEFIQKLKEDDKLIYTHTINNLLDLKQWEEKGVYGFYTDHIFYDKLLEIDELLYK